MATCYKWAMPTGQEAQRRTCFLLLSVTEEDSLSLLQLL